LLVPLLEPTLVLLVLSLVGAASLPSHSASARDGMLSRF